MTLQNHYEGFRTYPDSLNEFSVAYCPAENKKWVLYHSQATDGYNLSIKIGMFDSCKEAQGVAEMLWRLS